MSAVDALSATNKRRPFARRWLVAFPRAIPAALFLAVAAITAISVIALESNARERSRAEVRDYARSIATSLDRRGNGFSSYLRAGAALFSTVEEVSPQTFRQFVAELRVDQNYRGAEGVGWVTVLPSSDADAFLVRVRARQPQFPAIRPSVRAQSEKLAPVTYFYPDTTRNRRALGFDMQSEPVRASAMDEAERTVMPTASGRIVLAQEGVGESPGFIIFMPVFRAVPGSEVQARQLAGYVFSSFDAGQFLDAAIERAPPTSLGVRLYDGDARTDNLLVSRSSGSAGVDRFEQSVTIANRELLLVIDAAAKPGISALSMITLIFGLALASMLALVMRLLARQAIEDEAQIAFFEEQNSIRNSLTRELNHRVKNTLANVLSMLSLTRRRASDLDDFADSLEGRIRALSATHDLLTGTDWGTTPIDAVIWAEMRHVVHGTREEHGDSLTMDGPSVELAPNDALSLGLAIHELGTNAAKFGALSKPGGNVDIRWYLDAEDHARVEWVERGGPPVPSDVKRGFGLDLIEKITAHELRHNVDLDFHKDGLRCTIRVAVRQRDEFQIREAPSSA